jgi:outer membrane receptor protein involved in Fe transport
MKTQLASRAPRLVPTLSRSFRLLLPGFPLFAFTLFCAAQTLPPPPVPESRPAPRPPEEEIIVMDVFNINETSQTNEWISSQAMSGTRTAENIANLPYQIQVLTGEFMDDFAMVSITDQLANVGGFAGVSEGPDPADAASVGLSGGGSKVRGFNFLPLRDGFKYTQPPRPANTRQVEVIKGPMSALYGTVQPGGVVNYISKRPTTRPRYELSLSGGGYDSWRAFASVNTPIVKKKLFLLAAADRNFRKSDIQWLQADVGIYYASVLYKPFKQTSLTVSYEMTHTEGRRAGGTPYYYINNRRTDGTAVDEVPESGTNPLDWDPNSGTLVGLDWDIMRLNLSRGGPNEWYNLDYNRLHIQFEQGFGKNWRLKAAYQWQLKEFDQDSYQNSNYSRTFGTYRSVYPRTRLQEFKYPYAFQGDLLGNFKTGPVRHALLFTADAMKVEIDDAVWRVTAGVMPDTVRWMDPRNPDWSNNWFSYAQIRRRARDSYSYLHSMDAERAQMHGFSVSERMFMFDERLILMGGLRYDKTRYKYYNASGTAPLPSEPEFSPDYWITGGDSAFTHSVGANYKVFRDNRLILFANYSTSFNTALVADRGRGMLMPNETGKGIEGGVKIIPNRKISLVLSAYEIEKHDIAQKNPDFIEGDGSPEFLGSGIERVKGVDLDMSLFLTRDLTILAAGSYVDSEVVYSDNSRLIGTRKVDVPDKNFAVSAKYKLPGLLQGFTVGANMTWRAGYVVANYIPPGPGQYERLYEWMPSCALWGGFIRYEWRSKKLVQYVSLTCRNAFDKLYVGVASSTRSLGCQVGLTYKITCR